jgi:hypothetical protein
MTAALARRDVPRQAANPDLSTELAGLPWHFKRETGPRPSPKNRFGSSPLSNGTYA